MHGSAQVSDAFAVNDSHTKDSFPLAGREIFKDNFLHILRPERVQTSMPSRGCEATAWDSARRWWVN